MLIDCDRLPLFAAARNHRPLPAPVLLLCQSSVLPLAAAVHIDCVYEQRALVSGADDCPQWMQPTPTAAAASLITDLLQPLLHAPDATASSNAACALLRCCRSPPPPPLPPTSPRVTTHPQPPTPPPPAPWPFLPTVCAPAVRPSSACTWPPLAQCSMLRSTSSS